MKLRKKKLVMAITVSMLFVGCGSSKKTGNKSKETVKTKKPTVINKELEPQKSRVNNLIFHRLKIVAIIIIVKVKMEVINYLQTLVVC